MMDSRRRVAACLAAVFFAFFQELRVAAEIDARPPDLHPFKAATKSGIRFGYINHLGGVVIPAKYEKAHPFFEGLAAVRSSGRWGNIDAAGAFVVPAKYDAALRFSEGLARVSASGGGNSFKYVDRSGRTAVPIQGGSHAADFSSGLASVQSSGKFGYIDRNGKLAIPIKQGWDDWSDFSDHLAPVQVNGKWGFINNRGRFVIPPRFDPAITYNFQIGCIDVGPQMEPIAFSEKLAAVGFGGKAGFIDWTGKFVIEPRFDAALPFSEGMARVRIDGKWGYIDRSGKVRIAPQFELAGQFSEGLAPVKVKGLWGYIDEKGALVLPHRFTGAGAFKAGLAVVESSGTELIYIDKRGRKVWDYPGD